MKRPDGERKETVTSSREDRAKTGAGARALLLLGVLLIALAYIIGFGLHTDHLAAFTKDFLFAVATAVLITWGLTRLMEIPHVADYVAGKLADLMFGERYLTSIRSSLPDLRRRIDRVQYGEAALGYPWSLYNFVNSKVHEFYKASFRRNFTVEIRCSRRNDDQIHWREKTTFLYVRNKEDETPATVRLFHKTFFGNALTDIDTEEKRKAVFNRSILNLELRVGDTLLKSGPGDRTKLVRFAGPNGRTAEHSIRWMVDEYSVTYDSEYRIPAEEFIGTGATEIRVEVLEEFVEPARDDVYYLGMVEPTEDFSLVCDFPEDVRLELLRFSMHDPTAESPISETPNRGHGMITIDGWLLPGHGGCVAWYGLAKPI